MDLNTGQQIDFKKRSGVLDFTTIQGSVSVPFDLPITDTNRKALDYIDEPASTSQITAEYEAILDVGGVLYSTGKFVLEQAQKKSLISGYFKADAGKVSDQANNSILDYLSDSVNLSSAAAAYQAPYSDLTSDFVFPWLNYRSQIFAAVRINPDTGELESSTIPFRRNANQGNVLCLCMKIKYILQRVIEGLGFTPIIEANDYLFNNSIFIGRQFLEDFTGGPLSLEVKDYAPDVSLASFLRSVRVFFGIAVSFNSSNNTCKVSYVKDLINTNNFKDLTYAAAPYPLKEKIAIPDSGTFSFGFTPSSDEEQIAPVNRQQDLPDPELNLGKIALVKLENRFWKASAFRDDTGSINNFHWQPEYPALFSQEQSSIPSDMKCDFVPVSNGFTFIHQYRLGDARIVNNGSGKVRIEGLIPALFGFLVSSGTIAIRITNIEDYGNEFHLTGNRNSTYIDLLTLDYQADFFNVDFDWAETNLNAIIPDVLEEFQTLPMVSIWHGLRGSASPYLYASSSNLDIDALTELLSVALRWEGAEGIIAQQFTEYIQLSSLPVQFTHQLLLKITDLLNFDPLEKARIDGLNYLTTILTAKLENRRNEDIACELEGRSV